MLIVTYLWQYHHPESQGILDKIDIDFRIDKTTLWDSLIYELGELECVDRNSECFYKHMVAFFRKWDLPIKELLNTLEYKYNPLENVNLQVQRNLDREVIRDLGRDIIGSLTSAITKAIDENRTYNDNQSGKDTRNITDNIDTTQDNSHTDSHYVSAFDQITPQNADTYDNRDTGTWTTTTDSDETKSDVLDWNSVKSATDKKTTGSDDNRKDDTTQNTKENETTGTGEKEGTTKVGIDRITYQELTDSQRRTVMFNIYNWIIDKFAKEFMIQLW